MSYIAPVSYTTMAPVNFRAAQPTTISQVETTPVQQAVPKNVKKDNSSQLLLSLAALGSAALAGIYMYKHHNVSNALKEAEAKAKDLQNKLTEAENKLKNSTHTSSAKPSKPAASSSGSVTSARTNTNNNYSGSTSSSGRSHRRRHSGRANNQNSTAVPNQQPTPVIQTPAPTPTVSTPVLTNPTQIRVKNPKTNPEHVINNINVSNVSHNERALVADAVKDTPTPKDIAEYRQNISYVKPTQEEKNVIANINSEARQATAESHRIGNNLSENSREALEQARAGMHEPNQTLNGTFFNNDANFIVKDGKIQKIITNDGREITDELKIAKYTNKRNIEVENLQQKNSGKPTNKGGQAEQAVTVKPAKTKKPEQNVAVKNEQLSKPEGKAKTEVTSETKTTPKPEPKPESKPEVKTETKATEAPKTENVSSARRQLTEAEKKAADERVQKALEALDSEKANAMLEEYANSTRPLSQAVEEICEMQVKEVETRLGSTYPEQIFKYSLHTKNGMSENEIADKLKQFGLFDGMQKVDETVVVNGENIRLLFKGIDFDVTSDGRLLKKLKNGYDELPDLGNVIRQSTREAIQNRREEIRRASSDNWHNKSSNTQRQKQKQKVFA